MTDDSNTDKTPKNIEVRQADGDWLFRTIKNVALFGTNPYNAVYQANYLKRVIGRVDPKDNDGIGVSTCWTSDFGYETALLDANGAHPVERYKSKEDAKAGHNQWVKDSKKLESVIKLGTPDGLIESKVIFLKRVV